MPTVWPVRSASSCSWTPIPRSWTATTLSSSRAQRHRKLRERSIRVYPWQQEVGDRRPGSGSSGWRGPRHRGAHGARQEHPGALLTRFYEVNSGSVCIDGIDVKNLSQSNLRKHVSVVLQDNVLFSGTILDNLRLASPMPRTKS